MPWTDLLASYPGGNRRLVLQGFLASLKKLEALTEASINDEEALNHYWPEIVEETARLKSQLVTPEEKRDQALAGIYRNQELRNAVRDRDGNTCQFCGETVNWEARNSGRAGTYISLRMDKPSRSPKEVFVGCRSCAEQRKRDFKDGKDLKIPLPLQAG